MAGPGDPSITAALERAATAYDALADRADEVEAEWQYVEDLRAAYLPAIRALAPADPLDAEAAVEAIDELVAEVGLIQDPHKAIDWLSMFPHALALAVGADVDAVVDLTSTADGAFESTDDDSADNPFGFLLGRDR